MGVPTRICLKLRCKAWMHRSVESRCKSRVGIIYIGSGEQPEQCTRKCSTRSRPRASPLRQQNYLRRAYMECRGGYEPSYVNCSNALLRAELCSLLQRTPMCSSTTWLVTMCFGFRALLSSLSQVVRSFTNSLTNS